VKQKHPKKPRAITRWIVRVHILVLLMLLPGIHAFAGDSPELSFFKGQLAEAGIDAVNVESIPPETLKDYTAKLKQLNTEMIDELNKANEAMQEAEDKYQQQVKGLVEKRDQAQKELGDATNPLVFSQYKNITNHIERLSEEHDQAVRQYDAGMLAAQEKGRARKRELLAPLIKPPNP
jgi:hypothetical protein